MFELKKLAPTGTLPTQIEYVIYNRLKEGEFGRAADARPLCVCVHRTVKSLK